MQIKMKNENRRGNEGGTLFFPLTSETKDKHWTLQM